MRCRASSPIRRFSAAARVATLLSSLLLPGPGALAQSPAAPISPGSARIWFYQRYEPYVSTNYATVRINGVVAGSVSPYGGVIQRDVPPGNYHLTADSFGPDVNQSVEVALAPGEEAYVSIQNLPSWSLSGTLSGFQRDTFYLRLVPPATARADMAQRPF